MREARLIRALPGLSRDAALYHVTPPLEGHEFIVVTKAVRVFGGMETLVVPSDADGNVTVSRLAGTSAGSLEHSEALLRAGCRLTEQ